MTQIIAAFLGSIIGALVVWFQLRYQKRTRYDRDRRIAYTRFFQISGRLIDTSLDDIRQGLPDLQASVQEVMLIGTRSASATAMDFFTKLTAASKIEYAEDAEKQLEDALKEFESFVNIARRDLGTDSLFDRITDLV